MKKTEGAGTPTVGTLDYPKRVSAQR